MFSMFRNYCKDVAEAETRSIWCARSNHYNLPEGWYSFIEMFCNDQGCDCRRCFFMVTADWTSEPLAYIGYGWESLDFYTQWMGDDEISDQLAGIGLEPMQPQSKYAPVLLQAFNDILSTDQDFLQRVQRHYAMMRAVVDGKSPQKSTRKQRIRKEAKSVEKMSPESTNPQGISGIVIKHAKKNSPKPKREKRIPRKSTKSKHLVSASLDLATYTHPSGKISEAFLNFLEPLLDLLDDLSSKKGLDDTLMIGALIWNSVIFDTVEGTTKHVNEIRKHTKHDLIIETMIRRKQTEFSHDLRLIGDYSHKPDGKGSFRLVVEAMHPQSLKINMET
jgi:hypothetical protein